MKNKKSFNRQEESEDNTKQSNNPTTIPIHSYWFFAIMVLIASSMFVKHGTVDIQMANTYYVIAFHYLVIAISILLLLFGFIYWNYRNNELTKWMTNFHSLLTFTVLGSFYMTCFQEATWGVDRTILLGIVFLLIAQIVLVVNIWLAKKR